MTHDEKMKMIEAMHIYGGSFAHAIGDAMAVADEENFQKLCTAFPELVKQYTMFAKEKKKEQNARHS